MKSKATSTVASLYVNCIMGESIDAVGLHFGMQGDLQCYCGTEDSHLLKYTIHPMISSELEKSRVELEIQGNRA